MYQLEIIQIYQLSISEPVQINNVRIKTHLLKYFFKHKNIDPQPPEVKDTTNPTPIFWYSWKLVDSLSFVIHILIDAIIVHTPVTDVEKKILIISRRWQKNEW